jgi:hypothetical protein
LFSILDLPEHGGAAERSISVFSYVGITSIGMRYSNIDPLHEMSVALPPAVVSKRPSANQ